MQRGLYQPFTQPSTFQSGLSSCILWMMESHSVYIHIPFCRHRCAYCDFNTYAGLSHLIPDYVYALQREIQILTHSVNERFPVHTIYFGGGTPSLLPISGVAKILHTLDACFDLVPNAEISLEANPGTLSLSYLQDLRSIGINRLSLGMQSAHPRELAFLERLHLFDDILESVRWARKAGFDNLSLDLIFGLPDQPLEIWEGSLDQGLNLAPEHFSLYSLTIEKGTPMYDWANHGLISTPDPDLAAEMYELASEKLSAAGYLQYEISNWARENSNGQMRIVGSNSTFENPQSELGRACRHNLQYWRNRPYFGFGAGAHGFVGGYRLSNTLAPLTFIRRLTQSPNLRTFPHTPATVHSQPIDRQTEMNETMMMGLRLTREGVSRDAFKTRFGEDLSEFYAESVDKYVDLQLLEWGGEKKDILRLTPRGYLLGNQVFSEFV
jgi:oxygen-independent coproporphyrinogen III oxidase